MKKASFYVGTSILLFIFSLVLAWAVPAKTQTLPAPDPSHSVTKASQVIGWGNKMPKAPSGFTVTKLADGFKNPRWIYVAPNADIFVADSDANQVIILRAQTDGKITLRQTFLDGLPQPFGMMILGDWFYVASSNAVWRYPYVKDQVKLDLKMGQRLIDLPVGGRHWTRNIVANSDGTKVYIAIGSSTDVAEDGIENESGRANIMEMGPGGEIKRVYASGLRNPVGMAVNPESKILWTAVNERDGLGDDLVPDYITEVKDGGFYGWPYSYFGQNVDARVKGTADKADLIKSAIVPDLALGAHTASLGLAFYDKQNFPSRFRNGAFIGQHGSWNRSKFAGYRVAFVPFSGGKPSGQPEDFLTGFIASEAKSQVYGRPVGVTVASDGALLVADDSSKTIWRVKYGP